MSDEFHGKNCFEFRSINLSVFCTRFIEILDLSHNAFTGTLPEELFFLKKLVDLRLTDNSLSGELYGDLSKLSHLHILHLDKNNFFGTLPFDSFLQMYELKELRVHNNKLGGQIPSSLGSLRMLKHLSFEDNSFTGNMPSSICQLTANFDLEHLTANCWDILGAVRSSKYGPNLRIECTCCTQCY